MRDKTLGWSISRYECFSICKRQYYYQYYALRFDDYLLREKVAALKELVSVPLFTGSVVHDLIAQILRRLRLNPEEISPEKFFAYAGNFLKQEFAHSKFLEQHYLDTRIKETEVISEIENCLQDFLASRHFTWIKESGLASRSDWVIEPGDFGACGIGSLKAFCKVDFAFPLGDEIYVLDWKTGKIDEKKHKKQLLGYVFYVMDRFRVEAFKVKAGLAYIGKESGELELNYQPEELENFKTQVKNETLELYKYCLDVKENIPLAKENFPLSCRSAICLQCNYQELCRNEF